MTGFSITTSAGEVIRFLCYIDAAPLTSQAFLKSLPFTGFFLHARVSGQEIWTERPPQLDIMQENSTLLAEPGEVAIGPLKPKRNKVAGLMGIFYGEGKLVDGGNIFARVVEEDLALLRALGDKIWKQGGQELKFEKL